MKVISNLTITTLATVLGLALLFPNLTLAFPNLTLAGFCPISLNLPPVAHLTGKVSPALATAPQTTPAPSAARPVLPPAVTVATAATRQPTSRKSAKHSSPANSKTRRPRPKFVGQPLTALEAIQRAETFIIANGYTDIAVTNPQQLTLELLDKLITVEQRLKLRYNSLAKTAYGYSQHLPDGQPGWMVVFRRQPTSEFDSDQGRAVLMQLDGQNIRMLLSEVPLSSVEEQIEAPPN
jgi:hypothetical protein